MSHTPKSNDFMTGLMIAGLVLLVGVAVLDVVLGLALVIGWAAQWVMG